MTNIVSFFRGKRGKHVLSKENNYEDKREAKQLAKGEVVISKAATRCLFLIYFVKGEKPYEEKSKP